ncbi:MAG: hypothetical protein OHK0026_04290 [Rhodocyclaceae bacterium]
MGSTRLSVLALALLCAGPAQAQGAGRQTYCCVSERGQRVCGDTLPAECYKRGYWVINEHGVTVRRVDPPLTAEERARRQAEAARLKEEQRARLDQQRRDRALLDAYADVAEIDAQRDRALKFLQIEIDRESRLQAEALAKKKKLDEEMEFYRKNPPPRELADAVSENASALRAHASVIEAKRREVEAVRTKYAEERRRYLELVRRSAAASAPR